MFLQHCVSITLRHRAAILTCNGNTASDTPSHREFLTWMQGKLDKEYDNAWHEMLGRDSRSPGWIRIRSRRTLKAMEQARELWEQQNGSVDAIPTILETVARDNYLEQYQVEMVSDDVFGS